MFERFTASARRVVVMAQEEARNLHNAEIGPEHLLIGLVADEVGTGVQTLIGSGVTASRVRDEVRRLTGEPALLSDADAAALRTVGIDVDEVLRRIEETFGPDALANPAQASRRRRIGGHLPFTRQAKKVLELALREALQLKDSFIGSDHILLGILRDGDGIAMKIITGTGVDPAELRRTIETTPRIKD